MKKSNNESAHAPGPWKFPRGSLESRVAARAMADRLRASEEVIHVIISRIGRPERTQELFIPLKADERIK